MSSACRSALIATLLVACTALTNARELRICADPNNLPFSNARGEGFENKIVALIARDLHATLRYTWWAQRRGFVRNTLKAGLCDLIPGAPSNLEMLATTAPYYRSTYVFVTRANAPRIASFDDPRLHILTVGIEMIGDDGANAPPAHALSRRGIVRNVRGYTVYGDYGQNSPPSAVIAAVAKGDIAVAVAWGPLAGYWAARQTVALSVTPVAPQIDGPNLPMVFDISMGVRKDDRALRNQIDDSLARRRRDIDAILARYHVPRVDVPEAITFGSRT